MGKTTTFDVSNKETLELQDFDGIVYELTGVDVGAEPFEDWAGRMENCHTINFTLNGVTFQAIENPDDGYRSSMREIKVSSTPCRNRFPAVLVAAKHYGGDKDILVFKEVTTGRKILEVGTDHSDSYYPFFVASFIPENMPINSGAIPEAQDGLIAHHDALTKLANAMTGVLNLKVTEAQQRKSNRTGYGDFA